MERFDEIISAIEPLSTKVGGFAEFPGIEKGGTAADAMLIHTLSLTPVVHVILS
jgi:hypothetical protein